MNSFLLNRELGAISPQALAKAQNERLLQSIQAATPSVHFTSQAPDVDSKEVPPLSHPAGVNSIAIDRFEGRYLLSAGTDSSVAIWDLEAEQALPNGSYSYHVPLAKVNRTSTRESLSINHISFYPFDSLAFLTSGFDRTLKLFSSETLQASATFELGSNIYSHATSNVASHLLVACATHHPAVRLVDLQSGSTTHSLSGHGGSIFTVAWHPQHAHILASGATDGTCRLWDIRRSASSIGVLDLEDSIGTLGYDGEGTGARGRERGRAHTAAANGLAWTEDGQYLLSTGHDDKMRVWDMVTGANTLANFGPSLKNQHASVQLPLIVPSHLSALGTEAIFYPNPREVLSFDLHTGSLLKRLRAVGALPQKAGGNMTRNLTVRTTSLAWRAHHVEMYSAHADGSIRCWRPRTAEDAEADEEAQPEGEDETSEAASRKRKREELDRIVRDLTKRPVNVR